VTLITLRVLIFRKSYINTDRANKKFYFLLALFVLRIYFLILSPNNLRILLGWDGLGLSSYLLVVYYSSNKANTSGIITLLINRFGDALILTALFLQIKSFS
jgi:NADH-ubiquinone oxidoreductase chain 5